MSSSAAASALWHLLVGQDAAADSVRPLRASMLSSVVLFPANTKFIDLFVASAKKCKTAKLGGILKDVSVSGWLIDALRTGVGWKQEMQAINSSIVRDLKDFSEFSRGLSSSTVFACLMECFGDEKLEAKFRLIKWASKCDIAIPVFGSTFSETAKNSSYVNLGAAHFCMELCKHFNNVLLWASNKMASKDRGFRSLSKWIFDNELYDGEADLIRNDSITMQLNVPYHPAAGATVKHCNLLKLHDSWQSKLDLLNRTQMLFKCGVLVMHADEIKDTGELKADGTGQYELINRWIGRLIVVLWLPEMKVVRS